MGKKTQTSTPLIKGYLPVRLTLPSTDEDPDDTFFYVKEHFAAEKNTLFVLNTPVVPGIHTRILLRSLLGRYGDVERVTVIANPRKVSDVSESLVWTNVTAPSFFPPIHAEGKFAHVVFVSSKEMKKAMKGLEKVMSSKEPFPGLILERLEIQTLQDETMRKFAASEEADNDEGDESFSDKLTGILAVTERYRKAHEKLSRQALLDECNAVMENYEDAEEKDRLAREAAKNEPDEDGFTKVTYSTTKVGSKRDLEEGVTTTNNRRGSKRSRTKKLVSGASTQADFYRFQTKEVKKNNLQTLRKKFEEDLAKIKKMKEEREYRPF